MIEIALSALVMLSITVEPLGTSAVFVGITANSKEQDRPRIAIRSVTIATVILVFFALVGEPLLRLLQITTPAFQLAGGLLLLLTAVDLIFARPSGLSSITSDEAREAREAADIAVFPLAIPLIAGPGALTAIVLLMQHAPGLLGRCVVFSVLIVVMGLTLASLLLASRLVGLLGVTGVNVVSRVSGILLAAIAMQFVLSGIKESGAF